MVLVFLFLVWNMYPEGPSQSPGRESRRRSPWKLQKFCILQYLKLGLKLTKARASSCIFSCALQYKVTGKFQKVQNFEFSSFLSEKVCMFIYIFLAGQYFANFESKQRVTGQCHFYSLQFHGHSVSQDFV